MKGLIKINWNTLSIDEWTQRFNGIVRSNILQSYDYARAICPLNRQKARWGLIEIDGKEAGLVQVLEAGFFRNVLHAVILDRGPLWFPGFGNAIHVKLFFDELSRQFPQRFGRKRRFIPETPDGPAARNLIRQTGLIPMEDRPGYETIWLDLSAQDEALRAALKSNWRNKLNKSEKADLQTEWEDEGRSLAWVCQTYANDKSKRGYNGPAPKFLAQYGSLLAPKGDLLVGRALQDGAPVAFTLFVRHGRSATYLAGWSSEEGRQSAAHQKLLWDGIGILKEKQVLDLDLGGVNDDTAAGVKTFKEGLGGQTVRLVGHYR